MSRLDHCSSSLNFGISRGFSNEFVKRRGLRFFRPLLYRLSYLGGTLILLEIPRAGAARNGLMV